jgi:uncharacterized membrane protein YhaH (DUF805 family)|tara:strand:+ start:403 stop:870 length:468 start_codon:yes stop_codon:yes gene_type:complete
LILKVLSVIYNIFTSFISTCKNIIDFKNRADRKQYIYYVIVQIIFNISLYPIHTLYLSKTPYFILYFILLVQAIFALVLLSLNIRRLHDINISGWWYMFYIIMTSLIYFYFVGKDDGFSIRTKIIAYGTFVFMKLFLIFTKGTQGTNRYGKPPQH